MQRLSLCIDIDGTLTDPYYWLPRANKYFNRNIKPEDVTRYRMCEVLDVEEKAYDDFYYYFGFTLHKEADIRNGVHDVINELYKTHYIHFVTARDEIMKCVSVNWLYRHEIPYDTISLLGTPDKVQKAEELESDIFIEDCYDNAVQLAQAGFEVLLLDCSYNQGPLLPNMTRVYDWQQVRDIIVQYAEKEAS